MTITSLEAPQKLASTSQAIHDSPRGVQNQTEDSKAVCSKHKDNPRAQDSRLCKIRR